MTQVIKAVIDPLDMNLTAGVVLQLFSPHASGESFDVSHAWTMDVRIEATVGIKGILEVYLQNDYPPDSSFITDPVLSFTIDGGTFDNGQTLQTVTNDTLKLSQYAYFLWKKDGDSIGTGTLTFLGFRSV